MTNKEWADQVTADELFNEIIERMSAGGYEEGVELLTILCERATADTTGALEKRLTFFINCSEALVAVHRVDPALYPDHAKILARGKAALAKLWNSPEEHVSYDKEQVNLQVVQLAPTQITSSKSRVTLKCTESNLPFWGAQIHKAGGTVKAQYPEGEKWVVEAEGNENLESDIFNS